MDTIVEKPEILAYTLTKKCFRPNSIFPYYFRGLRRLTLYEFNDREYLRTMPDGTYMVTPVVRLGKGHRPGASFSKPVLKIIMKDKKAKLITLQ